MGGTETYINNFTRRYSTPYSCYTQAIGPTGRETAKAGILILPITIDDVTLTSYTHFNSFLQYRHNNGIYLIELSELNVAQMGVNYQYCYNYY